MLDADLDVPADEIVGDDGHALILGGVGAKPLGNYQDQGADAVFGGLDAGAFLGGAPELGGGAVMVQERPNTRHVGTGPGEPRGIVAQGADHGGGGAPGIAQAVLVDAADVTLPSDGYVDVIVTVADDEVLDLVSFSVCHLSIRHTSSS